MTSLRGVLAALGFMLAPLWLSSPIRADEPVFRFVHAAQAHGYGEAALDYLEQLRALGRVPRELNETWDLELSRSYRAAVAEAFNAAEAETRQAKAQTHLDKFLKEHPDHPAVAGAMESWGDMTLDRALEQVRAASGLKDAALKEKHLAAARSDLEEAGPRYVNAAQRYLERLSALRSEASEDGKRPRSAALLTRKQREAAEALRDAELAWLDCRFKAAKIDFHLGQTIEDRKSPQRQASFKAAAGAFDDLFQSYRESLVGLHAHLWHGRSVDELGNDQLALDIYDEVLATAPEGRERAPGLEPLFAQAQYHRLLVVKRVQGLGPFLEQANEWLKLRRPWEKFDAYQGVALAVAKTNLAHAEEIAGAKKGPLVRSALASLAEIARSRGPYQQEAILLRRQYTQSGAQDLSTVKTFDEGFALAESASDSLDWPAAAAALERALELRASATDKERVAEAQKRLDYARYQWAAAHYTAGKFAESLALARKLMDERSDSPLAPPAASLAVAAALSLYAGSENKQESLAELAAIAKDTIQRWPDKAEADDARIALGQASLVRGEVDEALKVFENVNPRSLRYPSALFLAGQTHWRRYLTWQRQGGPQPGAERLAGERTTAEKQLRESLGGQRKSAPQGEPMSRQMLETQLLYSEVVAEAGRMKEAAELVEPLVEWIRAQKPDPLDNMLLRVFLAAARAEISQGELGKAAETAGLLFELAPDAPAANGVLISIVKTFGDRWHEAEAEVIEAGGDAARRSAAESEAEKRKKLVAGLLAQLVPRKEQSLAARIYLADTSAQLNETDTARTLYLAILAQGDSDPAFGKANAAALTRIRTQLVGLIRRKAQKEDEFKEGLKQVDELIAAFPNALEPKMEKGRLLQAWADVDPARLADAVAHWTLLRTRLARARRKPPEYYEVVYNAASCLATDSLKTGNREKALQAEQLLTATLVLSPRLSGPEMVAQYKVLLQQARQLQGRAGASAQK
ncbi:MAG: hypothetical protein WD063_20475 [Pirellulales bacterium]